MRRYDSSSSGVGLFLLFHSAGLGLSRGLVIKIARGPMGTTINFIKGRLLDQATIHVIGAAGIETAAGIHLAAQLFLAGQGHIGIPLLIRVGDRDGLDQHLHIGMLWILDYPYSVTFFGDGALIENINIIADLVSRAQVVGNIEEGNILLV